MTDTGTARESQPRFCTYCGEPLAGHRFCTSCGADTKPASPSLRDEVAVESSVATVDQPVEPSAKRVEHASKPSRAKRLVAGIGAGAIAIVGAAALVFVLQGGQEGRFPPNGAESLTLTSLGGIQIGDTEEEVRSRWGSPDSSDGPWTYSDDKGCTAAVNFKGGVVDAVSFGDTEGSGCWGYAWGDEPFRTGASFSVIDIDFFGERVTLADSNSPAWLIPTDKKGYTLSVVGNESTDEIVGFAVTPTSALESAESPGDLRLIDATATSMRLGAWRIHANPSLGGAVKAFGSPSRCQTGVGEHGSIARWPSLGVRVQTETYGGIPIGQTACSYLGMPVFFVTVTRRTWRTSRGLRVGDSVSKLRRLYPNARFEKREPGELIGGGYWIVSARKFDPVNSVHYVGAQLIAQVRGKRVSAFVFPVYAQGE